MKEAGISSAGRTSTIRIKEREYKPARRRPGILGKLELYFLDEVGKFTV